MYLVDADHGWAIGDRTRTQLQKLRRRFVVRYPKRLSRVQSLPRPVPRKERERSVIGPYH